MAVPFTVWCQNTRQWCAALNINIGVVFVFQNLSFNEEAASGGE
jgi:hypothetical protein